MKKLIIALALFIGMASGLSAATMRSAIVRISDEQISYSKNYTYNLDNNVSDSASVQVVYSSQAISAVTFNASSITLASGLINQPNSFILGLPVLLSTTTGATMPTGLTNKATYYITGMTSTEFQFALTSTGAVAGLGLTYVSSGTVTATVTPISILGTFVFKLQGSNDGTTFSDLYISSMSSSVSFQSVNSSLCSGSFATPFTASSIMWDLGAVSFSYLRLAFTTGTWGVINLNSYARIKSFK